MAVAVFHVLKITLLNVFDYVPYNALAGGGITLVVGRVALLGAGAVVEDDAGPC